MDILVGYRQLTSGSFTWFEDVDLGQSCEKRAYLSTIPAQDHAAIWKDTLRYNLLYEAGGFGRDPTIVSESEMVSVLSSLKWSASENSSSEGLLSCLDAEIDPTRLSSGEKQRLLLARALLSGKDILFMDEGLSALPPDVDAMIWPLLRQRFRTIVLVTHQWRDVVRGDALIGMENGSIFEAGTLAELVRRENSLLRHCFHSDVGFAAMAEQLNRSTGPQDVPAEQGTCSP